MSKCVHEFREGIGQATRARCIKCRDIVVVKDVVKVLPILAIMLVLVTMPSSVYAWDLGSFLPQTGGYYAGQQDAIYDHTNNLNYNPQPQVNLYHSPDYWSNFRQGYDQQWNSYQSSNVYVNNSPGASVTVGQNSEGPRYQNDEGWSGGGVPEQPIYQPSCGCLPPPPPPPPCGCCC